MTKKFIPSSVNTFYEAGHQIYTHLPSLEKLKMT
jgi:hypothetical protein